MNPGDVVPIRGRLYLVTRIRPDGEPCLTRLAHTIVRAPGGGLLGQ